MIQNNKILTFIFGWLLVFYNEILIMKYKKIIKNFSKRIVRFLILMKIYSNFSHTNSYYFNSSSGLGLSLNLTVFNKAVSKRLKLNFAFR